MNRAVQAGIILAFSMWEFPSHGQEIHIRVLNARTGKTISDDCLNVSLGPWHGADLLAPTNKNGVVVLHLAKNEVTADPASPSWCDRIAILGPKLMPKDADTIAVTSGDYVDCQEWAKAIPGEAAKDNLNRAPSYRIQKILEVGFAAGNRCGKFKADAKPGELILFVRPFTWWERMRL